MAVTLILPCTLAVSQAWSNSDTSRGTICMAHFCPDEDWNIQSKHWHGFLISKLVSENSPSVYAWVNWEATTLNIAIPASSNMTSWIQLKCDLHWFVLASFPGPAPTGWCHPAASLASFPGPAPTGWCHLAASLASFPVPAPTGWCHLAASLASFPGPAPTEWCHPAASLASFPSLATSSQLACVLLAVVQLFQ